MPRPPKRGLEEIIHPQTANSFETSTADTDQNGTSEPKKRGYPSREGKVPVQVFITEDAHTQLRIACAERKTSNQEILIEALNAWFTVNDLPPIA